MSQIGYMIMGVSVGAYAAGPVPPDDPRLLQGAAVHGARARSSARWPASSRSRRWAAFARRCRSPTAASSSAAWRCRASRRSRASSPRTRSCSSPASAAAGTGRCTSIGYIGAFLTAIYTFRMIFRAFHGEPVPEARELEGGPPAPRRACPRNPATGEVEDTDVGFPGPDARDRRARAADARRDGVLAVGAIGAGLVQIPKVDFVIDDFLRPAFAGSTLYEPHTRDGLLVVRAEPRHAARPGRHRDRLPRLGRQPGAPPIARARALRRALYELFVNKWYFDELIDALVVRPAAAAGRFARDTFERVFVDETLVGGTTGHRARRLGGGARGAERLRALLRRAARARRRRRRLLLPAADLTAERPMPPLSILIWLPAACGLLGALWRACGRGGTGQRATSGARAAPSRRRGACPACSRCSARSARSALAIGYIADYSPGRERPAARHRRRVDLRTGHPLQARRSTA